MEKKKNGIEYKRLYVSQHFIMRGAGTFQNHIDSLYLM